MNINFCGKLIIDKSFNSLKQSDKEEIIALTKRVLDSPKIQEIIPEDIVLLGKNSKKGDIVEIRYGKSSFEINSNGKINSASIIQQILLKTCEKYGKKVKSTTFPDIMTKIAEILKENSAKIN